MTYAISQIEGESAAIHQLQILGAEDQNEEVSPLIVDQISESDRNIDARVR